MGKTKQTFRKFVDIKIELLRVKPKSEHNRTIKMYSFFERFNGNDSVPWRIISVLNQISLLFAHPFSKLNKFDFSVFGSCEFNLGFSSFSVHYLYVSSWRVAIKFNGNSV